MQEKKRNKDRKPIYLLLAILAVFALFVLILIWPSEQSKAIEEINVCMNKADVKKVWDNHKAKLLKNDDFINAVRGKLTSFKLNENEINECISWLPPAPTSINLIVVPDLSRRIINIPNRIPDDIEVLDAIWKFFKEYSELKSNTKDRLIIDVTDSEQAGGLFRIVADSLQFDLSVHTGQIHKLYFTPEKDKQYNRNIAQLYNLAEKQPLGANYVLYFRNYLESRITKPTLFNNYINKVIILTDGYIEIDTNQGIYTYTPIDGYQNLLYDSVLDGNILEIITSNGLNIRPSKVDLSNTEICVCEITERWYGVGYDFQILETYWTDWLNKMNAKKIIFIQKEDAGSLTKEKLKKFIYE